MRVDPVRHIANEGSVSVIRLTQETPVTPIMVGLHSSAITGSPDGRHVVVANAGSDTLSVIDRHTNKVVETIWAKSSPADLFGASPNALAFHPSGDTLFVANGTQYNQTSILRSIELILGLPPMNQVDATATAMGDCFTDVPDLAPYVAAPANVPLDQMNPDPRKISDATLREDAIASARLPLEEVDRCAEDVLNRILWHAMKGPSAPYPLWAVAAGREDHERDRD